MTTRQEIDAADERAAQLFFNALVDFYDLKQLRALDMFARDGMLTVKRYFRDVKSVDCWELNEEHREALKVFHPREIVIGDSYKTVKFCTREYGLIIVDTPQGIYGGGHVEHFDMIPLLPKIMADRCIVVLYVNKQPYDKFATGHYGRDEYPEYDFKKWMKARDKFYGEVPWGSQHVIQYVTEVDALRAYNHHFLQYGFKAKSTLMIPCYDFADGLPPSFRVALELVRA